MCYMVYVSTDCTDDLSLQDSSLVRFERPSAEKASPCPRVLRPERAWFVASASGCSCTFRHLCRESISLGFGEPEDWCPEEPEEIDATKQLYSVLRALVERGHDVEVLDCWSGEEDVEPVVLDVSLSQVPAAHFRLFEGHLFRLKP
jgi:hypothetical protein